MRETLAERLVYWDSCAWIGLINEEPDKRDACRAVWTEIVDGKTELHTSVAAITEVYRVACEKGRAKPLETAEDAKINTFMRQSFVNYSLLDEHTALLAKKLLREHHEISKPMDGVHLATAILRNVDELHTYDGADLTGLSGKVKRIDGNALIIRAPEPLPLPPEPSPPPPSLFNLYPQAEGITSDDDENTS